MLLISAFMAYVLWHVVPELTFMALGPLSTLLIELWIRKKRGYPPLRPMSLPLFLTLATLLLAIFVFTLRILVMYDLPEWSYIVLLALYLDANYLLFQLYRAGLTTSEQADSHPVT